jgi:toxin FitB
MTWLAANSRFADRILPVAASVAEEWGRLNAISPRNTIDSLIAATARVHDLTVVTRNVDEVEGCDVQVLNPSQPDASA